MMSRSCNVSELPTDLQVQVLAKLSCMGIILPHSTVQGMQTSHQQ